MTANGKIPSTDLKLVQRGKWAGREADIYLALGPGNAYLAMAAACQEEAGRSLEIAEPMGGYRPYADQAQMRADWYAHNWARYNLDPHSTVPPARAGTSNHGLGLCADIWGTGYEWAIQNAHRWGFSRPFPDTDPHHFEHDGRTAVAAQGQTSIVNTDSPEEDEMKPLLIGIKNKNGTKQWALVSPDLARFVPIWVAATANNLSKMFGTLVYVAKDEWNGFRAAAGLPADNTVG